MKKTLLSLLTLFAGFAFSQSSILLTNNATSATLAANTTIDKTTTAGGNTKVTIDIKNTSTVTQVYNAIRYDKVLNANATSTAVAYYCFAGNCYGDNVIISPISLTLTPGQSASQVAGQFQMLVADLDEASTVGYSLVRYTFKNVSNANDSVQVSIRYNAALSVNEISNTLNSVEMFPNPCVNNTTLEFTSSKSINAEINIVNALGSVVTKKQIALNDGKNKIELNTSELAKGVYLVNIKSGDAVATKRLIIK